MSIRTYPSPPVHEVILDIQFHDRVADEVLSKLPPVLEGEFANPKRADDVVTTVTVGAAGQESSTTRSFGGWLFEETDPRWVLRAAQGQLTLHLARSRDWPSGPYPGWEVMYARFLRVFERLTGIYQSLTPKRLGLRYLNRIAIPDESDVGVWFNMKLQAPPFLKQTFTFNWSQVWGRVSEYDDVSAKIGVRKIKVEDPALADKTQGVLLDIDVFNLWVAAAPSFAGIPDWFSRAHAVENQIFEACITDELRLRFE